MGFLHEWDPDRMPICRIFKKHGVCNEPGCSFKHSVDEIKDCNMYKLGFCIYGKACSFKHNKKSHPPPKPNELEAAKPAHLRNDDLIKIQANPNLATELLKQRSIQQFQLATSLPLTEGQ